jgi:hypothetical protein
MASITETVARRFPSGWKSITSRLKLWVNQGLRALNIGKIFAPVPPGNVSPLFKWQRGGTAEPCSDCLELDGVIKTAEQWQRDGIEPQSPDLECGGWNCQCQFVPV